MHLSIVVALALVACGSATPEPTPARPSQPGCTLSKECGPGEKCMRVDDVGHCFASPPKTCDAPECGCFTSDPCAANALGRCVGYETGVVICGP